MEQNQNQGTKGTRGTKVHAGSLKSLKSLSSLSSNETNFIPPHGGYQRLLSYQKALIVYDATIYFCERFIDKKSRTYDQMIQAARSGKQNILEASEASGTSKEAEVKLTGVAKASQKELLEDYRDFMRNHAITERTPDHPHAQRLRKLNRTPGANYQTFKKAIEHPDPGICANVIAGLIKVTCHLLDKQLHRLEQDFLRDGGLRERMTYARLATRANHRFQQLGRTGPSL